MTSNFHKHHRKRRAHGGSGEWGNMIELPSEIHELVHANPELAYQRGLLVKSHDDPNQIRPNVRDFCADLGVDWPPTKPKKKKNSEKDSPERRQRRRISIAVPKDKEDGGGIYDDILSLVKQRLFDVGYINPDKYPDPDKYPAYEATIAAWVDWLNDA